MPKTLDVISNFKSNILSTYQGEHPELVEAEVRNVIYIYYCRHARVLKYKPNVVPSELIEPLKELVNLNSIDLTTMSRTSLWLLRESYLINQKKIFRVKYDGPYNELGFYFFAGKRWIENLNLKMEISAYLLGDYMSYFIKMPIELGENGEKEFKDFSKSNPESPHIPFINSQLNLRFKSSRLELKAENEQKAAFSFEGFKNELIYIDFWATWCAPCIKEIPDLKLLESEYAQKISFVKVSIDEDVDKWRQLSNLKKLTYSFILKAEEKEQIIKRYGVFAVPRYMIVDKTGKIINANAPRPSDPKLKELLDGLLR